MNDKNLTDLVLTSSALMPKSISYFSQSSDGKAKQKPWYHGTHEAPPALEPLLELIVALANDIPKVFYEHHFSSLLPHMLEHTYTKKCAQIEQIFTCIVSIIIKLRTYLQEDAYKVYSECFAELLSNRRPWYINDMASQCLAVLVRKLTNKELFFYKAFKRLKKDNSQTDGLGRLLTAVMKSNSLNRIHGVTSEVVRIVLNILTLKSIPTQEAVSAIITGLKGLAFFVSNKNSTVKWQDLWKEDANRVWKPIWEQLDIIAGSVERGKVHTSKICDNEAENEDGEDDCEEEDMITLKQQANADYLSDDEGESTKAIITEDLLVDKETRLNCILKVFQFLVSFKRGALLLDVDLAFENLEAIISKHSSKQLGDSVSKILIGLLTSPNYNAGRGNFDPTHKIQMKRNKLITMMFESKFPSEVIFVFARGTIPLRHFTLECLPQLLRYLNQQILSSCESEDRFRVLILLMEVVMYHQHPIRSGEDIDDWNPYPIQFVDENHASDSCDETTTAKESDEKKDFAMNIPDLINHIICQGLCDDLSNCQELITAILCFPHVSVLDKLEINVELASILSTAINSLQVAPELVLETKAITSQSHKKAKKVTSPENDLIELPPLDLNVNLCLDKGKQKLLFLVDVIVETIAHTLSDQEFLNTLSSIDLINVLKKHPQYRENPHLLRAIDIYLTIAATTSPPEDEDEFAVENPLSAQLFQDLYQILAPSLASPSFQARLVVTHILSLFTLNLPPPPSGIIHDQHKGMFSIMYQIESLQLTALNYNERLRLMSLIDAEHVNIHSPVSGACAQAPLLFGIGQFYVNLSPIWGYTVNYLSAFVKKFPESQFWPLWLSKLKLVSHAAHNQMSNQNEDKISAVFGEHSSLTRIHEYLMDHDATTKLSQRVDHANARNLMWKTMHQFPQLCESKGKDLVTSFVDFLELEMHMTDSAVASTQNLLEQFRDNEDDEAEDLDELEPTEEEDAEERDCEVHRRAGKLVINSLCNYLVLFSKFSNLKCVPHAQKLESIFLDLLIHPSTRVQQLALQCIISFKHNYIVPYEKSLLQINNDKSFRFGVLKFRIDERAEHGSSIDASHRQMLMPIYIRLLYGKMQTKSSKTSRRSRIVEKKSFVIRLLAGIKEDESECLLKLAFELLMPYIEGCSSLELVNNTFKGIDGSKSVPLKRMLGVLGTLEDILQYLGNLIPSQQPFFLKVILLIISHASVLRNQTENVHASHNSMLRKLSHLSISQLLFFVDAFPNYNWSVDDVEAVFNAVVWPSLSKLPEDGINNVHFLLKLFSLWSDSDKFHPLFIKHHPDDKELYPLHCMLKLAANPKCKLRIINYIIDIINNLIGFHDDDNVIDTYDSKTTKTNRKTHKKKEEKSKIKELSPEITSPTEVTETDLLACSNILPVTEPQPRKTTATLHTFGLKILLPHVVSICKCLQVIVHQVTKKNTINDNHLRILCLFTEYVHDSAQSDKLLSLIIPLLNKRKTANSEVISHLLITCSHLLPISTKCHALCMKMLDLFSVLSGQRIRKELHDVFVKVADEHPRYKILTEMMHGFDSYERIDVADNSVKLDTYNSAISKLEQSATFNKELIWFICHQCFYDLNNTNDNDVIRESAIRCFTALLKSINKLSSPNNANFKLLIVHMLTEIKRGIKVADDNIHCTHMKLLGILLKEIGAAARQVEDLCSLIEHDKKKSESEKLNFFQNMCSQQLVCRAQTVSKLSTLMQGGTIVLAPEVLEDYIWPLVSRYLTQAGYDHSLGLVNASLSCLGVIAAKFPWSKYYSTLKFFLNQLTGKMHNPRIGLKAVCEVLDAFHEDVSGLVLEADAVKKLSDDEENSKSSLRKNKSITITYQSFDHENDFEKFNKSQKESKNLISDSAPISQQDAHGRKVYRTLVQDIIPSLKRVITNRNEYTTKHKINKATHADFEDIKKIPVALPLVKLLKKFPPKVLDANLGNVFYTLISFLKSPVQYIRRDAREMLVHVLREAGSKYLHGLVKDLKSNLCRGFLKHVFLYTVRFILSKSEDFLNPEHLNLCVGDIVKICSAELFTRKDVEDKNVENEEKEAIKCDEEKGEKSFVIMIILGKFVFAKNLEEILVPLKQVLETTQKKTVVELVEKCLSSFMNGLCKNKVIPLQQKSILIYGILTEKVAQIKSRAKSALMNKTIWDVPDRMLLEPEPKRLKLGAKTASTTNSYVLVEFAFDLLEKLLATDTFDHKNKEHCSLLDPFIMLLGDFIQSDNPQVTVACLKCFNQLVKFNLPALKIKIDALTAQMFVLLSKYSTSELEMGPMFKLVQLTFRSLAVIMKSVPHYKMQNDHARVLLVYMKENLQNEIHQDTVFALLFAIIHKGIDAPELAPIMETIRTIIITGDSGTAMDQARSVHFEYFTKFPIKSTTAISWCKYYRDNLDYPEVRGRISSCLMLDNLISIVLSKSIRIEQKVIRSIWLKLLICLIQEDNGECRKHQQYSLMRLFEHTKDKQYLVKESLLLMKDDSEATRTANATNIRLGCLSFMSFMSNLPTLIESNADLQNAYPRSFLTDALPRVVSLLHPSRFTPIPADDDDGTVMIQQLCIDKSLLELMQLFGKLHHIYRPDKKWKSIVNISVWDHLVDHLLYEEFEVRMLSGSLLGKLFSEHTAPETDSPCVACTPETARGLVYDFVEMFKSTARIDDCKFKQFHLMAVRNLTFLVKQSSKTPLLTQSLLEDNASAGVAAKQRLRSLIANANKFGQVAVSATWVTSLICKLAHAEFTREKSLTREATLNLVIAMALTLGEELAESGPALDAIMYHIAMETDHAQVTSEQESIVKLLEEVTAELKERLGWKLYSEKLVEAEMKMNAKRRAKRDSKKVMAVKGPALDVDETLNADDQLHSKKRKATNVDPVDNTKKIKADHANKQKATDLKPVVKAKKRKTR